MRIVGIRRDGGPVEVAALSDDGEQVTVVAPLEKFWADAAGHLGRTPAGPTLAVADVERVPPVLPGARVVCIGLNYLKHVAEGSFREEELPPYPTLFARWTASLTVDGADHMWLGAPDAAADALMRTIAFLRQHLTNEGDRA